MTGAGVPVPEHAVLAAAPAAGGRPSVTYRQAGDRCVLVEYGPPELDLRLNFHVLRMLSALGADPPPGLLDAAPGLRSVLLCFDPSRTARTALVDHLHTLHERQPDLSGVTLPSRRVTLPLAFDDTATREAVVRYARTIRPDASNTRGGNNIDYIAAQNGLPGRDALYEAILATEWWTAFTGFAPGLPFLFPLRGPTALSVPKYNPTRAWTPEGAVGIGGPCVAIYPAESPGSYQLFGRTLPVSDVFARNRVFGDDPFLLRAGDRVRFTLCGEEELLELRRQVLEDQYVYRIEDAPLALAAHVRGAVPGGTGHPDGSGRAWAGGEVP
ncbi:5-oxoprolinase subunit B family protein [Streptomyces armeniacus]|uniref:5-oxoprolinase subunit B family protein n=1 Tax=Streptomyces armeniacus TaxID=83291 RepID=UPI001AD811E1|nr:carboxyltransferase domain-containing protein [Streptomyces armeniacus]